MSIKKNIDYNHDTILYSKKATLAQLFAVIAPSFLCVGFGLKFSISTIVIKALYQNSTNDFSISSSEAAWYGSVLYIIQPIGCILSGISQERFGKKRCMMFSNVPSIFGWIILFYANSPVKLYISNLMFGFSMGYSTSLTHPYIGEIIEPRLRGIMATLLTTATFSGNGIGFVLSFFFEWRTVALLSILCPITCICLISFIPESPIWLVTNGEIEKAEKSLCWLRGWTKPEVVQSELLKFVHYSANSGTQNIENSTQEENNFFTKLRHMMDPTVYRPFYLLLIYFFVAFTVGLTPGRPFLGQILQNSGVFENQNLFMICFLVLQCFGSLMLTLTIHRLGKRRLSLLTVFISSIMLILLGFYVIAIKYNYINPKPSFPIIILSLIYFSGSCGVLCISWILLSEIFPNKNRGFITGLFAGSCNILLFILTNLFPSVVELLSFEFTVIVFGCIGIVGFIFFLFCLPETEGKSLLEIEEFFAPNSKSKLIRNK